MTKPRRFKGVPKSVVKGQSVKAKPKPKRKAGLEKRIKSLRARTTFV